MRRAPLLMAWTVCTAMLVFVPAASAGPSCPSDAVLAGTVCIDTYEASVWKTTDARLIRFIRAGSVSLDDLIRGGATQLAIAQGDLSAEGCSRSGTGCQDIYAVSIAGVAPADHVSWFQAVAASRNSGKRLPTNAEWTAGALGTPDGLPCRIGSAPGGPRITGNPGCVSDVGAFDMVGNVWEWVAEWVPLSTACPGWVVDGQGVVSDDTNCLAGASPTFAPGALMRGGDWSVGTGAGVLAVNGANNPVTDVGGGVGFRAVRPLASP
jgi:formylglycine-generating enzyme required for sulfatase activity